jgi:hypothetical protein
MDSLTNFSQISKIVIIQLEKEEIPCSLKILLFLTHVQMSDLFSYFETHLVMVDVPHILNHIFWEVPFYKGIPHWKTAGI